jgi:hypothetical protein
MGVFGSIQNSKIFLVLVGVGMDSQAPFNLFFGLLRLKSKMENKYF